MAIRNLLLTLLALLCALPAAAQPLRVDAEWLNKHLGRDRLVVLDVRLEPDYLIDHIPGAVSFPDALTYQQKTAGGRIVEPDVLQKLLRERGIRRDDQVVVYDNGAMIDASRVFWTLEVYGLQDVRVLDQGYAGWLKANHPVNGELPLRAPSDFVPAVDHRRIASKFSTQLATLNPKQIVVDARPLPAYRGETSTAKRFGHIPTAISIPVHQHLRDNGTGQSLRTLKELQGIYANLPKDGKVILYCEMGRVSSTNYLALRELGYDVANYDASWQEWGNDLDLPIEK